LRIGVIEHKLAEYLDLRFDLPTSSGDEIVGSNVDIAKFVLEKTVAKGRVCAPKLPAVVEFQLEVRLIIPIKPARIVGEHHRVAVQILPFAFERPPGSASETAA
jgi:hypothetical protein